MVNDVLFLLVILGANIIQGITGFAGTILAMSPACCWWGIRWQSRC